MDEGLRAGYAGCPDRLEVLVDPEAGHTETPAMRARALEVLARGMGRG
jgi:hypothetical protein